jgi:hypothetical protein
MSARTSRESSANIRHRPLLHAHLPQPSHRRPRSSRHLAYPPRICFRAARCQGVARADQSSDHSRLPLAWASAPRDRAPTTSSRSGVSSVIFPRPVIDRWDAAQKPCVSKLGRYYSRSPQFQ